MAAYRVFFKRSVEKDVASIPKKDVKRILNRIKTLEEDPRPPCCEIDWTRKVSIAAGTMPDCLLNPR
jgi:mRNA-degrading endonuclease RelE of RelBE toxin-antitoxin system